MNSHVNQQLVAGIERLLPALASCPVAGEVISPLLVNVLLLNVGDKLRLVREHSVTVYPHAQVFVLQLIRVLLDLSACRDSGVILGGRLKGSGIWGWRRHVALHWGPMLGHGLHGGWVWWGIALYRLAVLWSIDARGHLLLELVAAVLVVHL